VVAALLGLGTVAHFCHQHHAGEGHAEQRGQD
jgi:hypothetical protein